MALHVLEKTQKYRYLYREFQSFIFSCKPIRLDQILTIVINSQ